MVNYWFKGELKKCMTNVFPPASSLQFGDILLGHVQLLYYSENMCFFKGRHGKGMQLLGSLH